MPFNHRRRSALIATLALAAAMPLAVRAALPIVELMLGDQVTVTCPTSLTSVAQGDQMVLTCLAGVPAGSPGIYRVAVPIVGRF
jgi:hypothetical protein